MKAAKKDKQGGLTTDRDLMYPKKGALNESRDDYGALGLKQRKKKKRKKRTRQPRES